MTQRMQDMSKRMDAQMREDWEKDKKATLTRWGWIKGDFQEE